jgi:hypothetical protein
MHGFTALCSNLCVCVSLASGVCCVAQEELPFDQKIVAFASSVFIQKITTNWGGIKPVRSIHHSGTLNPDL